MIPTESIDRLRLVLRANATTSGLGGVAGLFGAGFFSDWMGVGHVLLTAAVSAGLIGFAALVAHGSTSAERAVKLTPLISGADFAWVTATVVVVASGTLTLAGNLLAIAVGVMVLDFGAMQMMFRAKATSRPQRVAAPS